MGDRETSQEAGRRAQARGGREGKSYLGLSQSPTAAQLLPEQPVTADVVGLASRKLFLSPFTPPHPSDDRGASSHPYREARPCSGSCKHQVPWSPTQWGWGTD